MQLLNLDLLIKKTNAHRPLVFNGGLWALMFAVLLFIFSKGKAPIKIDYIYTVSFLFYIAIPVLINFYILIPKFLKTEKYGMYVLLFLLNLVGFAVIFQLYFYTSLNALFPSYFFISYLSNLNSFIIFSIILVATTLLKLAEDWFYFNATENRLLKLKNTQIETQLYALRAQMNPHFLFNSLNVIYSMALDKNQKVTKAIVQLSDILRYVIYDSDTERVTLRQELELIKNYIAFQNYRVQNSDVLDLRTEIENESFKIYPMLLLPLIENSFKYGLSQTDSEEKIKISMIQKGHDFYFAISNKNHDYNTELDKDYSGVGLKTLENNLNLVYPNRHEFNIETSDDHFKVSIKIKDDGQ